MADEDLFCKIHKCGMCVGLFFPLPFKGGAGANMLGIVCVVVGFMGVKKKVGGYF